MLLAFSLISYSSSVTDEFGIIFFSSLAPYAGYDIQMCIKMSTEVELYESVLDMLCIDDLFRENF